MSWKAKRCTTKPIHTRGPGVCKETGASGNWHGRQSYERERKGHATKHDVEEGKNNENDREGTKVSDDYVDVWVLKIGGQVLVRLGAWLASRHDAYIAFMRRAQRMIGAISRAEEERANRIKVKKATLGYDPKKWLKTQVWIRDERKYDVE